MQLQLKLTVAAALVAACGMASAQEQVVKICSFYCAFGKGERHEVN